MPTPPPTLSKADILKLLDELGWRFVKTDDPDPAHFKALGLAFSTAYYLVTAAPEAELELLARTIEVLGLGGGSTHA